MSLSEKIRGELQDNYLHKMCGFCIQDMKPPLTSLTTDSVKNILSLIREEVEKVKGERPYENHLDMSSNGANLLSSMHQKHLHEAYNEACDRILELLEGK